jgi:hypothetical protein
MLKIFKYIEPLWLGSSNKISIRRFLALVFAFDFVINLHHSIFVWEIGKSHAEAAMLLGIEAGLIAALLSLTTYSNSLAKKQTDENE